MHPALCVVAASCVAFASVSSADEVVFTTGSPFGGPMGVTGFDVYAGQSVAARFTPTRDCTLTSITLWLMTNNPAGHDVAPTLQVSLRDNLAAGRPGGVPLVNWVCATDSAPFSPAQQLLVCEGSQQLIAGQEYWIVAESGTVLQSNPIWNWSGEETGYIGLRGPEGEWSCGPGVGLAIEVRGEVCRSSDYDGDGDAATDADIEAFFACIAGNCCATCSADYDGDGDVATDFDIEAFFSVLTGAC